eukprot:1161518-Pelagomonas_calceolata.AAC.3
MKAHWPRQKSSGSRKLASTLFEGNGGRKGDAGVKGVGRYNTIRDLLSDVQVMLSLMDCAAYIHMYKGIGSLIRCRGHYPYDGNQDEGMQG